MASAPSAPTPPLAPMASKRPEIITIPEQFYGVALKLKAMTSAERDEAARTPPPAPKPTGIVRPPEARQVPWMMIGIVAGVIIFSILGFIYFNRDTLFRAPAPAVVEPPPPEPVPLAPSGLSALGAQGAVSLGWTDAAANEQGYHIERKEGEDPSASFIRITTLAPNSTAFIDVTVQPGLSYVYRVIAAGASGDSAPSNEAPVAMSPLPAPQAPLPTFPPGGLDSDSDGLTDIEEVLYGTNSLSPDSDGDGYLDGNEVFHLYNPAARAPGRLIESGLVRALTSSSGWVMYVPTSWTSTPDETDAGRLVLESGRGERFVISVESNPSEQPLASWVSARVNEPVDSFGSFTTKGGLQGVYSADRMRAWLSWGDAVFHITYELRSQPFLNFRTTLEMMLNSLSLNGAAVFPTTLTPANSGPGSLLSGSASSTEAVAPTEPVTTTSSSSIPPAPESSSAAISTSLELSSVSTSTVSVSDPSSDS